MTLRFTASVPGELRFRDLVGAMLRAVCLRIERDAGCDGLEWRMISAFNEAFNNVVEHAYAMTRGDIEVSLLVEDDRIELHLADHGDGFDFGGGPAENEPPAFEGLSEGGMGLFIIRSVMSAVVYERRADRNLLIMTKTLSGCTPALTAPAHGDQTRC